MRNQRRKYEGGGQILDNQYKLGRNTLQQARIAKMMQQNDPVQQAQTAMLSTLDNPYYNDRIGGLGGSHKSDVLDDYQFSGFISDYVGMPKKSIAGLANVYNQLHKGIQANASSFVEPFDVISKDIDRRNEILAEYNKKMEGAAKSKDLWKSYNDSRNWAVDYANNQELEDMRRNYASRQAMIQDFSKMMDKEKLSNEEYMQLVDMYDRGYAGVNYSKDQKGGYNWNPAAAYVDEIKVMNDALKGWAADTYGSEYGGFQITGTGYIIKNKGGQVIKRIPFNELYNNKGLRGILENDPKLQAYLNQKAQLATYRLDDEQAIAYLAASNARQKQSIMSNNKMSEEEKELAIEELDANFETQKTNPKAAVASMYKREQFENMMYFGASKFSFEERQQKQMQDVVVDKLQLEKYKLRKEQESQNVLLNKGILKGESGKKYLAAKVDEVRVNKELVKNLGGRLLRDFQEATGTKIENMEQLSPARFEEYLENAKLEPSERQEFVDQYNTWRNTKLNLENSETFVANAKKQSEKNLAKILKRHDIDMDRFNNYVDWIKKGHETDKNWGVSGIAKFAYDFDSYLYGYDRSDPISRALADQGVSVEEINSIKDQIGELGLSTTVRIDMNPKSLENRVHNAYIEEGGMFRYEGRVGTAQELAEHLQVDMDKVKKIHLSTPTTSGALMNGHTKLLTYELEGGGTASAIVDLNDDKAWEYNYNNIMNEKLNYYRENTEHIGSKDWNYHMGEAYAQLNLGRPIQEVNIWPEGEYDLKIDPNVETAIQKLEIILGRSGKKYYYPLDYKGNRILNSDGKPYFTDNYADIAVSIGSQYYKSLFIQE